MKYHRYSLEDIMLKYDNNAPKKGIAYTVIIFAIALLVTLVIVNISPITIFMSSVSAIIAPIVLGAAIAYLLNPLLKFFEFIIFKKLKSKKVTRALSLVLTYAIALLVIVVIFEVLAPRLIESIIDLGKNYNFYITETMASIDSFIAELPINSDHFNVDQLKNITNDILNKSGNVFETIVNYAISSVGSIITVVKNILLGLFISIYILISKERLYAQCVKGARAFLSHKAFRHCMRYLRVANSTFIKFFVGKLIDCTIVFSITFVVLAILKIPHTLFIAMVIGVLNIIPFFGFIVAIVFTAFIVFIAAPEKLLIYLLAIIIIEQIDANIIAPKILGNSAGISSLGVIIAVTIMGTLFGPIGMIIGVPVFAIIIAIFKEWLEKKLASKKLPIDTREYYTDPTYSSESEENKSITKVIFEPVLMKVSKRLNNTISDDLHDLENDENEDEEKSESVENTDAKL